MKLFKRISLWVKEHSPRVLLSEYRWILGKSLQYKGAIAWYMLAGIFGVAAGLAGSLLSKYIIDSVNVDSGSSLVTALLLFVTLQLVQIGVSALTARINTKLSLQVNQQLTAEVYDRLLDTEWEALSQYHSGDLLSRMMGDVSTVSSSVLGWVPDLVTRLLQFAGTFCVLLYYDRTLALLALLSAPVTLLISRYAIKMMRRHSKRLRQLSSEMTVFNEESFQNIQLIKAFDQTPRYSRKHRRLQEKYKEATLEYNLFSIRKNTVMSLVATVVTVVCFGWSVYRLKAGFITFGAMTLFLQLSGSLGAAFSALAALIPGAINAATAAGRVMAVTQLPCEDHRGDGAAEAFCQKYGNQTLSIHAKDLTYGYEGGRTVLSNVNFTADDGQIIAFVGPSGEGKTTILRLLLGIVRPGEGSLTLQAHDGTAVAVSAGTRKLFAYVPQGNVLFSGTVAENLRMRRPDATEEELYAALDTACAGAFIRELPLGLDTPVKEQGIFSEGQLQRICIARALLSDAPVLLLDEATSALDPETERKVLANIMASRSHRTCILTTHRPGVLKYTDHIYYVNHDGIVAADTLKEGGAL